MIAPETSQLEHLSHAELVDLVRALIADKAALRAELARLQQPPATSRNSSQPPSRDHKKKRGADQPRKKHGPPLGPQRHTRALVDQPDQVMALPVVQCQHGHASRHGLVPAQVVRCQVTAVPLVAPVVIETRQHEVRCPQCQTRNRGTLPLGLEAERQFGARLEASVLDLTHQQQLSYARVVQAMRELWGLELREGGVGALLERAARRAQPQAAISKEQVSRSAIIHSDETSARIKGQTWWQGGFGRTAGVSHQIAVPRNAAVITELMGASQAQVWVSDCFSAQLKAPATVFQLCLVPQLRDLQRILDAAPQHAWAQAAQKLLREAIHLHQQFDCAQPTISRARFVRQTAQLDEELDKLLRQKVKGALAQRLPQRCTRHRDKLLTFLPDPDVPPTNNVSERALRPSVIHRQVTNGFRSQWGAQA